MSMKKIAAFIVVAGLLVGGEVMAEGSCHETGCWNVSIKRLLVKEIGVLIQDDGDHTKFDCSLGQYNYLTLSSSQSNFKEIYSMLLAAKISGKKVSYYVYKNDENGLCMIRAAWID